MPLPAGSVAVANDGSYVGTGAALLLFESLDAQQTYPDPDSPPPGFDAGAWVTLAESVLRSTRAFLAQFANGLAEPTFMRDDGANGSGGLSWQGDWDLATDYADGAVVVYDGAVYVCIASHSGQEPPDATYWQAWPGGTGAAGQDGTPTWRGDYDSAIADAGGYAIGDAVYLAGDGSYVVASRTLGMDGWVYTYDTLALDGPAGADGADGPAGLTWRGLWSEDVDYVAGDAVHNYGSAYVCTGTHTADNANEPLDAEPNAFWDPLAAQGSAGGAGPSGTGLVYVEDGVPEAVTIGEGLTLTGSGERVLSATGGAGESFATANPFVRREGEMVERVYRSDYTQTSGTVSGVLLMSHAIGPFEAADVEAVVTGFGRRPESGGIDAYYRRDFSATAYRTDGSPSLLRNVAGTRVVQGAGTLFSAALSVSGNNIEIRVSNDIGGIVDWACDARVVVPKTTETSWGPSEFSPLNVSGIWSWHRADYGLYQDAACSVPAAIGDPVGGWLDRSGNGRTATMTDAYAWILWRPINAGPTVILNDLPALDFDQSDDGLQIASSPGNEYTIFAVYYARSSGYRRVVQGQTTNWLLGPWGGAVSYFAGSFAGSLPYAANTAYIHTVRQSTSVGSHRANGVAGSFAITPGTVVGNVAFGARGAYAEPVDGRVAEIIIYSRALTDGEISSVELYLAARYGITI